MVLHCPRLLIHGPRDMGQAPLAAALLQRLGEGVPVFALGLPDLMAADGSFTPEEACTRRLGEAYRSAPSVVYLPRLDQWWGGDSREGRPTALAAVLELWLSELPTHWPVLMVCTSAVELAELPRGAQRLFSRRMCFKVWSPLLPRWLSKLLPPRPEPGRPLTPRCAHPCALSHPSMHPLSRRLTHEYSLRPPLRPCSCRWRRQTTHAAAASSWTRWRRGTRR